MKNRKSLYSAIALLFAMPLIAGSGYVSANDTTPLAEDQENPDPLVKAIDPEKKNASYGESNIVISGDGEKHNEIVTPDPLESSLNKKHDSKAHAKGTKVKPKEITEDDMAIEPPDLLLKETRPQKKAPKKSSSSSTKNNDLEMPDPLLDSMN